MPTKPVAKPRQPSLTATQNCKTILSVRVKPLLGHLLRGIPVELRLSSKENEYPEEVFSTLLLPVGRIIRVKLNCSWRYLLPNDDELETEVPNGFIDETQTYRNLESPCSWEEACDTQIQLVERYYAPRAMNYKNYFEIIDSSALVM